MPLPRNRLWYRGPKANARVQCLQCGKKCKQKSLNSHMKYVHGNIASQCAFCHTRFQRPCAGRIHVSKKHGIDLANARSYLLTVEKSQDSPILKEIKKESNEKVVSNCDGPRNESIPLKCFNCGDCEKSFTTIPELFIHCQEDHKAYRTLKKIKIK